MFRKVAIALVAASLFAAPVMAETATAPASSKPATTSSAPVTKTVNTHKTVKAHKSAKAHKMVKTNKVAAKSSKQVRPHHATRMASHGSLNKNVKHARHFNNGKTHKLAGTAGKVAAAKPVTRSSAN
jgi:hypothetical protein